MDTPTLTFGNYTDPTTNGASLTGSQLGMSNAMGNLSMGTPVGGAVQGVNVAASTNPVAAATTDQTGASSFWKTADGSFNTDNLKLVLGGIQTLGSLWNSYQQHKIAKEQIALSREAFQTNLENNKQTYNTALEDRIRARYHTENRASSEADSYLSEHKL